MTTSSPARKSTIEVDKELMAQAKELGFETEALALKEFIEGVGDEIMQVLTNGKGLQSKVRAFREGKLEIQERKPNTATERLSEKMRNELFRDVMKADGRPALKQRVKERLGL